MRSAFIFEQRGNEDLQTDINGGEPESGIQSAERGVEEAGGGVWAKAGWPIKSEPKINPEKVNNLAIFPPLNRVSRGGILVKYEGVDSIVLFDAEFSRNGTNESRPRGRG